MMGSESPLPYAGRDSKKAIQLMGTILGVNPTNCAVARAGPFPHLFSASLFKYWKPSIYEQVLQIHQYRPEVSRPNELLKTTKKDLSSHLTSILEEPFEDVSESRPNEEEDSESCPINVTVVSNKENWNNGFSEVSEHSYAYKEAIDVCNTEAEDSEEKSDVVVVQNEVVAGDNDNLGGFDKDCDKAKLANELGDQIYEIGVSKEVIDVEVDVYDSEIARSEVELVQIEVIAEDEVNLDGFDKNSDVKQLVNEIEEEGSHSFEIGISKEVDGSEIAQSNVEVVENDVPAEVNVNVDDLGKDSDVTQFPDEKILEIGNSEEVDDPEIAKSDIEAVQSEEIADDKVNPDRFDKESDMTQLVSESGTSNEEPSGVKSSGVMLRYEDFTVSKYLEANQVELKTTDSSTLLENAAEDSDPIVAAVTVEWEIDIKGDGLADESPSRAVHHGPDIVEISSDSINTEDILADGCLWFPKDMTPEEVETVRITLGDFDNTLKTIMEESPDFYDISPRDSDELEGEKFDQSFSEMFNVTPRLSPILEQDDLLDFEPPEVFSMASSDVVDDNIWWNQSEVNLTSKTYVVKDSPENNDDVIQQPSDEYTDIGAHVDYKSLEDYLSTISDKMVLEVIDIASSQEENSFKFENGSVSVFSSPEAVATYSTIGSYSPNYNRASGSWSGGSDSELKLADIERSLDDESATAEKLSTSADSGHSRETPNELTDTERCMIENISDRFRKGEKLQAIELEEWEKLKSYARSKGLDETGAIEAMRSVLSARAADAEQNEGENLMECSFEVATQTSATIDDGIAKIRVLPANAADAEEKDGDNLKDCPFEVATQTSATIDDGIAKINVLSAKAANTEEQDGDNLKDCLFEVATQTSATIDNGIAKISVMSDEEYDTEVKDGKIFGGLLEVATQATETIQDGDATIVDEKIDDENTRESQFDDGSDMPEDIKASPSEAATQKLEEIKSEDDMDMEIIQQPDQNSSIEYSSDDLEIIQQPDQNSSIDYSSDSLEIIQQPGQNSSIDCSSDSLEEAVGFLNAKDITITSDMEFSTDSLSDQDDEQCSSPPKIKLESVSEIVLNKTRKMKKLYNLICNSTESPEVQKSYEEIRCLYEQKKIIDPLSPLKVGAGDVSTLEGTDAQVLSRNVNFARDDSNEEITAKEAGIDQEKQARVESGAGDASVLQTTFESSASTGIKTPEKFPKERRELRDSQTQTPEKIDLEIMAEDAEIGSLLPVRRSGVKQGVQMADQIVPKLEPRELTYGDKDVKVKEEASSLIKDKVGCAEQVEKDFAPMQKSDKKGQYKGKTFVHRGTFAYKNRGNERKSQEITEKASSSDKAFNANASFEKNEKALPESEFFYGDKDVENKDMKTELEEASSLIKDEVDDTKLVADDFAPIKPDAKEHSKVQFVPRDAFVNKNRGNERNSQEITGKVESLKPLIKEDKPVLDETEIQPVKKESEVVSSTKKRNPRRRYFNKMRNSAEKTDQAVISGKKSIPESEVLSEPKKNKNGRELEGNVRADKNNIRNVEIKSGEAAKSSETRKVQELGVPKYNKNSNAPVRTPRSNKKSFNAQSNVAAKNSDSETKKLPESDISRNIQGSRDIVRTPYTDKKGFNAQRNVAVKNSESDTKQVPESDVPRNNQSSRDIVRTPRTDKKEYVAEKSSESARKKIPECIPRSNQGSRDIERTPGTGKKHYTAEKSSDSSMRKIPEGIPSSNQGSGDIERTPGTEKKQYIADKRSESAIKKIPEPDVPRSNQGRRDIERTPGTEKKQYIADKRSESATKKIPEPDVPRSNQGRRDVVRTPRTEKKQCIADKGSESATKKLPEAEVSSANKRGTKSTPQSGKKFYNKQENEATKSLESNSKKIPEVASEPRNTNKEMKRTPRPEKKSPRNVDLVEATKNSEIEIPAESAKKFESKRQPVRGIPRRFLVPNKPAPKAKSVTQPLFVSTPVKNDADSANKEVKESTSRTSVRDYTTAEGNGTQTPKKVKARDGLEEDNVSKESKEFPVINVQARKSNENLLPKARVAGNSDLKTSETGELSRTPFKPPQKLSTPVSSKGGSRGVTFTRSPNNSKWKM